MTQIRVPIVGIPGAPGATGPTGPSGTGNASTVTSGVFPSGGHRFQDYLKIGPADPAVFTTFAGASAFPKLRLNEGEAMALANITGGSTQWNTAVRFGVFSLGSDGGIGFGMNMSYHRATTTDNPTTTGQSTWFFETYRPGASFRFDSYGFPSFQWFPAVGIAASGEDGRDGGTGSVLNADGSVATPYRYYGQQFVIKPTKQVDGNPATTFRFPRSGEAFWITTTSGAVRDNSGGGRTDFYNYDVPIVKFGAAVGGGGTAAGPFTPGRFDIFGNLALYFGAGYGGVAYSVSAGIADSGGAGYRLLRVIN